MDYEGEELLPVEIDFASEMLQYSDVLQLLADKGIPFEELVNICKGFYFVGYGAGADHAYSIFEAAIKKLPE